VPRVTETREFEIPSCKIDKELISSLGRILESDSVCQKEKIVYSLDSRLRKIESENSSEFIATDWPNDARRISMVVGSFLNLLVTIQIDFKYTSNSKVTVSSTDATWANGISSRIEDAFKRKRLGYSSLTEDTSSKLFVTVATWFSVSLALTYLTVNVSNRYGIALDLSVTFWGVFMAGGFIGGVLLFYFFLGWLFPKYEFGETLQKRFRKWIWSLLIGSGIITIIIDKLMSL